MKLSFFKVIVSLILVATLNAKVQNTPADEKREISLDSEEPLFVSLGPECYLAWNLEEIGYRRAAFPFDWLLTLDHERMVELLNDDFRYFLDPMFYSYHTNGSLVHSYYHLEFRHEHDYEFNAKYERRINRFRQLNTYRGKVFFMRKGYYAAEEPSLFLCWPNKDMINIRFECATQLNSALKKRFPNLNFNLAIFNYSPGSYQMQIVDDIIIFNLEHQDRFDQFKVAVEALVRYAKDPSKPLDL